MQDRISETTLAAHRSVLSLSMDKNLWGFS